MTERECAAIGSCVALGREGWEAVVAALEGSGSYRDAAFDALLRWAPEAWLDDLDSRP